MILHTFGGMNHHRRHLAGAYVSSVISISLMLVLTGLSVFLVANAAAVSDYFKENIRISVMLRSGAGDGDAASYAEKIRRYDFVRDVEVITREKGEEELRKMLGEDFLKVFETSPVPVSVDVFLKAEYVEPDSLARVSAALAGSPLVEEVSERQSLVEAVSANMTKISLVLGAVILMLLFVSFILIGNTVRVSLFNKRFTIHTMKQVGATGWFICTPFLKAALIQGLISSALATGMLAGIFTAAGKSFPALFESAVSRSAPLVAVSVFACGIILCELSALLTTLHLISMDKDQLYY